MMPDVAYKGYEEEYVLKDTFNAHLDRIEVMMERNMSKIDGKLDILEERIARTLDVMEERIARSLAEYKVIASDIEGEVTELRGETREANARLEGKIETLTARMDSFQHRRYWDIAWFGVVVGAVMTLAQMFSR